MNKIDYAARLWDRAEECRALAELSPDLKLKVSYQKLANAYLRLAAQEEALNRLRPAGAADPP